MAEDDRTEVPAALAVQGIEYSGDFTITGRLVAMIAEDVDGAGAVQVSGSIQGGTWTVENVDSYQAAASVAYQDPPGSSSGVWNASNLTIQQRPGLYYLFASQPAIGSDATLTLDKGSLAPAQASTAAFGDFLRGAGTTATVSTKHAMLLPAAGKVDIDIHGELNVSLWAFTAATEYETLWAGERRTPLAGTPSPLDMVVWSSREQVIHAQLDEVALGIYIRDHPGAKLYLDRVHVQGTGEVRLEAPSLPGGHQPIGSALVLRGNSRLTVTAGDHATFVDVEDPGNAELDGVPVHVVAATDAPASWFVPALAAALLLMGLLTALSRSPQSRLRALDRHLRRRNYVWVARRAGPALRSKKTARRASAYKATSLLAMEQFREARLFLAGLTEPRRPDAATHHFLTAHAASGLGQDRIAAKELEACLAVEPSYRADALAIPLLRRLLQEPGIANAQGSRDAYA